MPKEGRTIDAQVVTSAYSANGPEGYAEVWDTIDWSRAEASVRRLRQRIFSAAQAGDLKRVRNLQKLMLRSRSNTLVSVRRVTQQSSGRRTPGVDGKIAVTSKRRGELVENITDNLHSVDARPVRRVYIPKANGKQRPLGIPVILDRANQARIKNALEPEWEALFEARSYGFRPGRGCQDAMQAIFNVASKGAKRVWALDADLAGAFDRINHDHLMSAIGSFPGREMIRGWLRAGIMESNRFAPTEEGTPQGGVVSPLLLNIALHGMSTAAGCLDGASKWQRRNAPVLVRYADDFVVFCHSEQAVHQVKEDLAQWLRPRGLAFNEDKTKVVHLEEGFDFLGFNVRHYNGKLLIKPSKDAVKKMRRRLSDEATSLRGSNSQAVIRRLNPIIRGWAAYYRGVVSKRTFQHLDNHMWKLTYKWAKHTHPQKSKSWVVSSYFGEFHPSRKDKWVFGDRNTGRYLHKFNWTKIERHVAVKGTNSYDDPSLVIYWASRARKRLSATVDKMSITLAARQKGVCALCKQPLIPGAEYEPDSPREWAAWFSVSMKPLHKHHFVYRRNGGSDDGTNLLLVHAECHRQHHAGDHRKAEQV
ncbi:group II intron reverse transcriptase/maturase [Streptomyces microflavus]